MLTFICFTYTFLYTDCTVVNEITLAVSIRLQFESRQQPKQSSPLPPLRNLSIFAKNPSGESPAVFFIGIPASAQIS